MVLDAKPHQKHISMKVSKTLKQSSVFKSFPLYTLQPN